MALRPISRYGSIVKSFLTWLALLLTGSCLVSAQAPSPTPQVMSVAPPGPTVVIELDTDISKAQFLYLRRALKEAEAGGASAIIIEMNTYGGEIQAALKSMQALARIEVPTYTFINTNAASAGALISLATDEIFMAPISASGAAEPVSSGGEDIGQSMKRKTISYLGGMARSVAQAKGHNPELVTAFIDPEPEVKVGDKVLKEKDTLLTLSAKEAVEKVDGEPVYAEGIVSSVDELIDRENLSRQRLAVEPSGFEQVALWITRLAPIFLLAGIAGAYLEFKTPGFGIPGIVAAVAFLLFFTGHYIAGLTGYGTLLLFFLGAILVVLEIFLLPGTLVLGVVGGLLMLGTLLWAMVDRYPADGWTFDAGMLMMPVLNLTIAFVLAGFAAWAFAVYLPKIPMYRGLILDSVAGGPSTAPSRSSQVGGTAPVPDDTPVIAAGTTGVTVSDLRPSGKVRIGELYLDAVTHGEYVEEGKAVVVRRMEGGSLLVTEQWESSASETEPLA